MDRFPKIFWLNKFLIAIFMLCVCISNASAQHSFIIKIPSISGYFPDVFEDEKNCIVATYNYRITRISPNGRKLWQNKNTFFYKGICNKDSQNYVYSAFNSEAGGFQFLAIDYSGNIKWLQKESLSEIKLRTIFDYIIDSSKKQYVVVGNRGIVGDLENRSYWIAGLDYSGHIKWEREWKDSGKSRYLVRILQNKKTNGFMLITQDAIKSEENEFFSVDSIGQLLERNVFEPELCKDDPSHVYKLDPDDFYAYNDGFLGLVSLSVDSKCSSRESGGYFYIYNYNGKLIERKQMSFDNAIGQITVLPNGDLLGYYFDTLNRPGIRILENNFNKKWEKLLPNLPTSEYISGLKLIKTRDGGYAGIICERVYPDQDYIFNIFKTDSFGNINPKNEYSEKLQPIMLQPNPATNQVRIAIPYYFGTVTARFYSINGTFLFEKTQSEQDQFDINGLSPGVYIVRAKIEETGEERTMRLFVY
jgi:hypothetical protein